MFTSKVRLKPQFASFARKKEFNYILTDLLSRHHPLTTAARHFAPLGFALILGFAGCTSAAPGSSPAPDGNASRREVWHDAELLAAREPGREVLLGAGESMAPVYGDGSVLVIRPVAYEQLRAGMTIVYLNQEGRRIAHRLLRQEQHGWRAGGLNNDEPDAELVTPENLLGVVYASLVHEPDGGKSGSAK